MHRPLFAGCFGDCEPTSVEDANVRYWSLADMLGCKKKSPLYPLKADILRGDRNSQLCANSRHLGIGGSQRLPVGSVLL
jgi:hypothetical protein